jgi:Family of unknown function (DUF6352)
VSSSIDFWLSSGHHLLDRGEDGGLVVTDEFLKAYLARPEVAPPLEACGNERALYRGLLDDPRQRVAPARIAAIDDADARENWNLLIAWRDHILSHPTLEAAYLALVREGLTFPPIFMSQIVQVILRNMLDDCVDVFVLRAAELFFRPQHLAVYEGSLLAADEETFSGTPGSRPLSPLVSLLGLKSEPEVDVLNEDNAGSYWERSDSFDLALDLTAGRRGLIALGEVVTRWIRHLLAVDVEIEAVTELRGVTFNWYVGLDASATRIGDTLWKGEDLDQATQDLVVGLFRLSYADDTELIEPARAAPTYLIAAAATDMSLRLKPQNLVTGLPVRRFNEVAS